MVGATQDGRAGGRRSRAGWPSAIPLLVIPLLAYVGLTGAGADFGVSRLPVPLPSGGTWQITLSDIVLAAALFLLFFEILKSTRTGGNSVVNHALSTMVLVACMILFLIWDAAATSTFFLIMLMTLIDVIAGFTVTINAARHD